MPRVGTLTGRELEGYFSSGEAAFGSVLMATGDGNCFWVYLPEIVAFIDGIDGESASDELSIGIEGGSASDSLGTGIEGGAA